MQKIMNKLFELYKTHSGNVSDKWALYINEYDRVLSPFKMTKISMLEIGIQNGGSLEIWSKFFPNANVIIGCDINQECSKLKYEDDRIKIVIGNVNSEEIEKEILNNSKKIDLIIDDGSHTSSDIIKTFAKYFCHVSDGGIFIVEDLHCSYWESFQGGLYDPYSAISFFKKLADIINYEHWGISKERNELLKGFSNNYFIDFENECLQKIHSIEFINSMCIVRKNSIEYNELGPRIISGLKESVVRGHIERIGNKSVPELQHNNKWSNLKNSPEEEYELLKDEISNNKEKADVLKNINLVLNNEIDALKNSTSWRITKPIRSIKKISDKIIKTLKLIIVLIKKEGVNKIIKKTYGYLRQNGLSGIKQGLIIVQKRNTLKPLGESGVFDRNNYQEWIKKYDTIDSDIKTKIINKCESFPNKTKISIVLPTFNPKIEWLIEAIESVKKQIYSNWELCIADDASKNNIVKQVLAKYSKEDARIKVVFREINGHISEASNTALEVATGDWIALLDHDDLIPEHALFCVVKSINENPHAKILYSDEDKIDSNGNRFDPYFKCEWNQDLFYSHNMISHLGVYERKLVEEIGGFRKGFEGSQDYDLALRCIEQIEPTQIIHIPHVLYHWRVHNESTALSANVKPYAMMAGESALNDHFRRSGVQGRVKLVGCKYDQSYDLPNEIPLVSIIIVAIEIESVKKCINSLLLNTNYQKYEIIVVTQTKKLKLNDNDFKSNINKINIKILYDENEYNKPRLYNVGVNNAKGDIVALIDCGIRARQLEWLCIMVSHSIRKGIGAVGPIIWNLDETLHHGGITLGVKEVAAKTQTNMRKGEFGYFGKLALTQNLSAISMNCMVIKKSIFLELGGLNDLALKDSYSDVDFCLKVKKAGFRNLWTPLSEVYFERYNKNRISSISDINYNTSAVKYMKKKWDYLLKQDPAYSPNLTLDDVDYSLSWPPRVSILSS